MFDLDSEEVVKLKSELRSSRLAQSGLSAEQFASSLDLVLSGLGLLGLNKPEVRKYVDDKSSDGGLFVDLVWDDIVSRAAERARVSLRGGLGNLAVMTASAYFIWGRHTKLQALRAKFPAWMTGEWVKFLVVVGFLTCLIHVARGAFVSQRIRRVLHEQIPVLPTRAQYVHVRWLDTLHWTDVRRFVARLLGSMAFLCAPFGAVRVAGMNPALGAIAWLLCVTTGLVLFGFPPRFALTRSLLRAIPWTAGAVICWQVAIVFAFLFWPRVMHAESLLGALLRGGAGGVLLHALTVLGARCFANARRVAQPSAQDLLAIDRRPSIAYLRSFAADSAPASYQYSWSFRGSNPLVVLSPAYWFDRRHRTFEEVVCEGLGLHGPVIAIGRPGDTLPALGASRIYVPEALWQEEVSKLIRQSQFVCLVIGRSDGLLWELERVVTGETARPILLVVPKSREYRLAWESFVREIHARGIQVDLPMQLPDHAIALCLRHRSAPVVVTGEPTQRAYRQAATILLDSGG